MKYLKANGDQLHEVDYSVRIETVTDDTTVDASWHNGVLSIATDAKVITLADSCPIGMKLKVENSGAAGNNIVTIVGSSTVGIGGRNQVINGTSKILTKVVSKQLINTKATSLQFDYVELTKISATEWDAVSHGIWAKEA